MSNVNNQFKELINEAIHNHFHDKTETEMILKDWLYGICEQVDEYEAKAKAWNLLKETLTEEINELSELESGFPYVDGPNNHTMEVLKGVLIVMPKLESGDSDEL